MKKILLAFQFLTIIPVKEMKQVSEERMGGASAFFPGVGLVQGCLLLISAFLLLKIFPVELVNGIIILVIVVINGAFHLDGLSDTFDAIAVRGAKEKKLVIMKDSTAGPTGVISIVLAILLKYLSLNALSMAPSDIPYYSSLFLMPVFSRWTMVSAICHAKSARQDGLGKIFIENTGVKELLTATLLVISCWLLVVVFSLLRSIYLSLPSTSTIYYSLFLLPLPVLYIFGLVAVWFSNKRFGGMTGDTFGAVSEISEILFLIMVVTWSRGFF